MRRWYQAAGKHCGIKRKRRRAWYNFGNSQYSAQAIAFDLALDLDQDFVERGRDVHALSASLLICVGCCC